MELRWAVPDRKTTEQPRLQWRQMVAVNTNNALGSGWRWTEWADVPTVVVPSDPQGVCWDRVCWNCETALPKGCGGKFKDDGEHCRLNAKAQS